MISLKRSLEIALVAWALLIVAPRAHAMAPTEQIKQTIEQVTVTLQEARLSGPAGKVELQQRLRRLLMPRFDFGEMAKRSLGKHWSQHQNRQEEFVPVFTGFIEHAYIGSIQSFNGEKILYVREIVDKNLAEVHTRIVAGRGEEVPVNYRLHLIGEEWKVYDVVIENISLVNNFRSQFNRILTSASFDELLKKLRERRGEQKS